MKPYILNNLRFILQPDLSLIICTRNRAESLTKCLNAIDVDSLHSVNGELILVDNGSEDSSLNILNNYIEDLHVNGVVISEPSQGLSKARNAGLKYSQGNTIVFTDDDCYLDENYFHVAHNLFSENKFSFCGGRILLHDNSDASYGLSEQSSFELIQPKSFIPPGKFQGANFAMERKVYGKIGGFDEQLGAGTPFRCEDIDYVARASIAGFTGAHVPELIVYHHHGRKEGPQIEKLKKENAYARGAYYMKFIKLKHLLYLWGWLRRSILRRRSIQRTLPVFFQELRGALAYLKTTEKVL